MPSKCLDCSEESNLLRDFCVKYCDKLSDNTCYVLHINFFETESVKLCLGECRDVRTHSCVASDCLCW